MKPSGQKAGRYVYSSSDEQDKIFQKILIKNNVKKCLKNVAGFRGLRSRTEKTFILLKHGYKS